MPTSTTLRAASSAAASAALDIRAAAEYLGVTERYMRRLVAERRVKHYKLGKFLRFHPADLDALLNAGVREAVPR